MLVLVGAIGLSSCASNSDPTVGTNPPGPAPEVEPAVTPPRPDIDARQLRQSLADFNRGAALLERYQYGEAAACFEKVLEFAPDWLAARFNLGLAYLNMQGQTNAIENLGTAQSAFLQVLDQDPEHLHARFCLGMYHQYVGDIDQARTAFAKVYEADPNDPHVAYRYAESLRNAQLPEQALAVLEPVVQRDSGFISAVYFLATMYTRMGQREKALPLFKRFQALNAVELTGGSQVVQATYGAAGKYYRALGVNDLPLVTESPHGDRTVVFSPRTKPWAVHGSSTDARNATLPGLAVADVDADGDLDVCLTSSGPDGETALWINDGSGDFSISTVLPSSGAGVTPCFGDVNNDTHVDLWLGRDGADQLWLNDGSESWQTQEYEMLAGPDARTQLTRLIDLDSDGDLDLLAYRSPAADSKAAVSLLSNNGDGTYTPKAEPWGLATSDSPIVAVVCDDFDNDFDMDLITWSDNGAAVVWVNNRLGEYRLLNADVTGLETVEVLSATTGDPDKDGDRDLLLFTSQGMRLLKNGGGFCFVADSNFPAGIGPSATGGQFADMDNDGDLDIVVADARRPDGSRGPLLLINQWPHPEYRNVLDADPGNLLAAIDTAGDASCAVADFTGNGRCDLLLAPAAGQPLLLENITPGGHWIALDLSGKRPPDNKARSNSSAIGARVEVKTGSIWQQFVVGGSSGPVSASSLRIHAGLGDEASVDWLRIIWPDTVLQAETELAADRVLVVDELSRKASSCPYLFVWTGERFEFVSDFGGVGGLGYLIEPGVYAPPDPTETVRLPKLEPLDGHYVLQSLTPLEEITYFDEAKLIAVDHPAGTLVYPNELMAISVPPPEFELLCFRALLAPDAAVDDRGRDVTADVTHVDRRYAGATRLDPRFTGLAEGHYVEFDFGDRLSQLTPQQRWVLVLDGWVEYGYSSTNYAAHQAGRTTKAPSIDVLRDGKWVELFHEVGYPAGVQHAMTVELSGHLLPGDHRFRIRSNMELYWDRITLGEHIEDVPLVVREVEAASADLHFRGYPREYSPDGRHPNLCDYDNMDRTVGWKLMTGEYTRFGDVTPLLLAADDRYVIMGHGEEVTLKFSADAFDAVSPEHQRTFLLKTDSFCKDMDLYTAHPTSVEPLPYHGMSGYPYGAEEDYPDTAATRTYRREYNTRRIGSDTP